jgi:hypothetical protein
MAVAEHLGRPAVTALNRPGPPSADRASFSIASASFREMAALNAAAVAANAALLPGARGGAFHWATSARFTS